MKKYYLPGSDRACSKVFVDDLGNVVRKCSTCHEYKPNTEEYFKPSIKADKKYFNGNCRPCLSKNRREEWKNDVTSKIIEESEIFVEGIGKIRLYDLNKSTSYVDDNGTLYKKCNICKQIKSEKNDFKYFIKKSKKTGRQYLKCETYCKNCKKEYDVNNKKKLKESGHFDTDEYKIKKKSIVENQKRKD